MDKLLPIIQSICDHWGLSAGAAAVITRLLYWEVSTRLPKITADVEQQIIADVLADLTAPEDVALFKAVMAWIDVKIPNAGDKKYDIVAAYIVAQYKPLQPYRALIAALLSAVGEAAKQGIEAQYPPASGGK